MGLFSKTPTESMEEIQNRVNNSEAAQAFLNEFVNCLQMNAEWCRFLRGNSRQRSIFLKVEKRGVMVEFLDFSRRNDYTVDSQGYSFGASGFADLPNYSYVSALRNYITSGLQANCPHLEVRVSDSSIVIKIKETAKKGW